MCRLNNNRNIQDSEYDYNHATRLIWNTIHTNRQHIVYSTRKLLYCEANSSNIYDKENINFASPLFSNTQIKTLILQCHGTVYQYNKENTDSGQSVNGKQTMVSALSLSGNIIWFYRDELLRQILSSHQTYVICLSPASVTSQNVRWVGIKSFSLNAKMYTR